MNNFVRNLITNWRKLGLPFADETFVIAVSGGADSVALALALHELKQRKKLDLRLVIAHFNHDLRGVESEKDAKFVKNLAESLDFEFEIAKGKFIQKGNLEQNARIARYAFLSQIISKQKAFAVLTAHTINDQAETFLMNLIRGSGLQGLSAMKSITDMSQKSGIESQEQSFQIIRPLLTCAKREDTEKFCQVKGFQFRQDEMNFDEKFFRVCVRKKIIPFLQEFNPKIVATLAKTSELLSLQNTAQILPNITETLIIKELKLLDKSNLYNVLREWLKHHRGNLRNINLSHIESIEQLIYSRKSGRIIELPKNEQVIKNKGNLHYGKTEVEKTVTRNYN